MNDQNGTKFKLKDIKMITTINDWVSKIKNQWLKWKEKNIINDQETKVLLLGYDISQEESV